MPRLSESLKKELYLESLRKRVRHLYTYGESHPSEIPLITAKLDGFLEAAGLLQIVNKSDLQKLIDDEHAAIFEVSRKERSRQKQEEGSLGEADWSAYDAPALERVDRRRGRPRRVAADRGERC